VRASIARHRLGLLTTDGPQDVVARRGHGS
jgi:hypothetical protein